MSVVTISSTAQFSQLAKTSKLIVIDFSAEWCGPCKLMGPVVAKLSTQYKNVVFCEIDVDEQQELAENFEISAMPTFLFYLAGSEVARFSGADAQKLERTIKKYAQDVFESTPGQALGESTAQPPRAESFTGALRFRRAQSVVDEESIGVSGDATFQIRLATGDTIVGKFDSKITTGATLYTWVHQETGIALGQFSLVTAMPRRVLGEKTLHSTLEELELTGRQNLILQMRSIGSEER